MSGRLAIGLFFLMNMLSFSPDIFGENKADMWMGEDDIHYRNDDHMQIRRTGSSQTARNRLAADCISDIAHAEYACYMAARVSMDLRDRKNVREYLTQAMRKNFRFMEPVNAWRLYFKNEPLPVPDHPAWVHSEAIKAARLGNTTLVIQLLRKLIRAEISPGLITGNAYLRKYIRSANLQEEISRISASQANWEERKKTGLWISPLYKILNTEYDRARHKKNPDEKELLYGFFNALSAKDADQAVGWLNLTYEKCIALGTMSKMSEIPAYYLVYVWQDKRLARIRKSQVFLSWFSSALRTQNIDEKWLNGI